MGLGRVLEVVAEAQFKSRFASHQNALYPHDMHMSLEI